MEFIDLAGQLQEEYQNKWIAYSPSESKVYTYDEDLEKLIEKIKKLKKSDLTIQRVLPFDKSFAPKS